MVSTYRREMWIAKDDGKVYKINRVPRDIPGQETPSFVLGVTMPVYYLETGIPSDAGQFAPPMASLGDPGIAGVIPGVTRSNYSSSINWSTPQVIENKNLTGAAATSLRSITGPDHVIRNCYVPGLDTPYTGTAQGGIVDCRASSVARLRLEHLTIRPTYPNDRWDGIYGHDFTAYRCLIERTVDCFAVLNQYSPNVNVNIEGCWGGHNSWYSDDRGVHTDGTHNDFLQHHTGLYLNVTGCTAWGYKWNTLNTSNLSGTGNGDVLAYTDTSGTLPAGAKGTPQIGNVIIDQTEAYYHVGQAYYDSCWIYGGGHVFYPRSKCGVSGHNHKYASNPHFTNITLMNDDQKDFGGSLHFYTIRPDASNSLNDMPPGSFPTTGATDTPTSWNCRYANVSNADRKLNVDPSRRGQVLKIRCDP